MFKIISILILICSSIYGISFGTFTWKNKNKVGAIAIIFIVLLSFILPMYKLIIIK